MIVLSSRRPRRRHGRGFTLVELMISLVMGLVVAMAAVGLAKTATTTFHEQARSSVTEMAVRTASERLRADLSRVSYMSTGNITQDPKVAHRTGVAPASISRYGDIAALRGVRITPNDPGSATSVATANGLSPDAIEIVGNMTTDDQYTGTIYSTGGGTCNQVVRLDPLADAAVYALSGGDVNNAASKFAAAAAAAFQPVAGTNYLAQVTDAVGCNHYVPVCSVTVTPNAAGTASYLLIGLDSAPQTDTGTPQRAVLYANAADGNNIANNCGSSELGQVTIAPLARVRWSLVANANTTLAADGNPSMNLVRQRLDFAGNAVANVSPEIIAEYGIDLKFGITYMDPAGPVNMYRTVVADMDSPSSAATIAQVTGNPTYLAGGAGPQSVRSIRYRIAVRTSLPDRDQNLPTGLPGSLARYCVDGSPLPTCKKFARVRTVLSEVFLQNQAGMSW